MGAAPCRGSWDRERFVHRHKTARKQPFAADLPELAIVFAWRQERRDPGRGRIVEEIAARAASVARDVDAKVADDMTELCPAPPAVSNLEGECAQACPALATADDGAIEPTIFGETAND